MGSAGPTGVDIVDIRRDHTDGSLTDLLKKSISPKDGIEPTFPTLLLYDEQGLRLFEEITYLDEYYLTNAEIETLTTHAASIVARIPAGSRLVELGSGNLRKIDILLQAFENAGKSVAYYALDLSLSELQRTFAEIDPKRYHYVSLNALHGTYDDALAWLGDSSTDFSSTCVITMGSSLGNFTRPEAAKFLESYKRHLRSTDSILVGLDACQNEQRVFIAYNDSKGITERFYRNGLDHANALLGYEAFKQQEWGVEGFYDNLDHKHVASYVALADIATKDFAFSKGHKLLLEYAYKYSEEQCDKVWHKAGLVPQMAYGNANGDYYLHLLSPSVIKFSNKPSEYAAHPVVSIQEWENLWSAWDTVTKSMVPRDELMNKPIQLRNDLIFYLGHIPTFADIHFTKATGLKPTSPAYYYQIFERGIDPDVDNPESCHDHSDIPDTWPPLNEILDYTFRVRSRIRQSINSGEAFANRKLSRGLWLAYEHEGMHLETFIYMLLQSSKVLPPPGQPIPNFAQEARTAHKHRQENVWHQVPAADVKIGLDDPETHLPPDRFFCWDNERPSRVVKVPKFSAQSRCISNGEYAKYLEETKCEDLPANWTTASGLVAEPHKMNSFIDSDSEVRAEGPTTASHEFLSDKAVRTVYGPIPLKFALDWPIMASYNELAAYALWAGGRIPTLEEARSIYQYAESQRAKPEQVQSKLISAVNGHLSNNGVQETPPINGSLPVAANGDAIDGPNPNDVFIDLTNCDVGFKTWYPSPVTGDGNRLRGQSEAGGLWEWTSSWFARYEGFKPMDSYPGYSADFFDEKHNIILGGSWATVPRMAGRKSFVNFFQRNYPYTWATARLVRDFE